MAQLDKVSRAVCSDDNACLSVGCICLYNYGMNYWEFFRPYGSQMMHPNNIGDPDFSSNTTFMVLI